MAETPGGTDRESQQQSRISLEYHAENAYFSSNIHDLAHVKPNREVGIPVHTKLISLNSPGGKAVVDKLDEMWNARAEGVHGETVAIAGYEVLPHLVVASRAVETDTDSVSMTNAQYRDLAELATQSGSGIVMLGAEHNHSNSIGSRRKPLSPNDVASVAVPKLFAGMISPGSIIDEVTPEAQATMDTSQAYPFLYVAVRNSDGIQVAFRTPSTPIMTRQESETLNAEWIQNIAALNSAYIEALNALSLRSDLKGALRSNFVQTETVERLKRTMTVSPLLKENIERMCKNIDVERQKLMTKQAEDGIADWPAPVRGKGSAEVKAAQDEILAKRAAERAPLISEYIIAQAQQVMLLKYAAQLHVIVFQRNEETNTLEADVRLKANVLPSA